MQLTTFWIHSNKAFVQCMIVFVLQKIVIKMLILMQVRISKGPSIKYVTLLGRGDRVDEARLSGTKEGMSDQL